MALAGILQGNIIINFASRLYAVSFLITKYDTGTVIINPTATAIKDILKLFNIGCNTRDF